jgi:hypothetical protein
MISFLLLAFAMLPSSSASGQQTSQPYIVEWVYKVKFGYQDEFWQIFQKYQIATLNKEKELGSVLKYEVFRPGLHTSEDRRWDYRIVIYYKEQRRWELTEVHWDLPIRQIDPNATE